MGKRSKQDKSASQIQKKAFRNVSEKTIAFRFAAGAAGAVLLVSWVLTGSTGISKEEKAIYQEAADLQEEVDKIGFQDFYLRDYPVAMYDGKNDYVFYQENIQKRTPVLETFAGTAYPVEDHYEVIIPTLERFESLLSLAGGVEGMVSESGYGKEEQIATIWHEALHAWQMSNFQIMGEAVRPEEMAEELKEDAEKESSEETMSDDDIIVKEVDKNTEISKSLEQEMKLLKNIVCGDAMSGGNIDGIKEDVLKYRKLAKARQEKMSAEAGNAEIRCELTEGTAYYVESNVFRIQKGNKEFTERYIDTLDVYEDGRGKYYRTGMAKCMILDKIAPNWKENIDFTQGLNEMLDEALGSV